MFNKIFNIIDGFIVAYFNYEIYFNSKAYLSYYYDKMKNILKR